MSRAQNYGFSFDDYKEWQANNLVVIAQIEHIDGVNNLKEIIEVEGIDAIIIGPYDLSGSLGYPGDFSKPELQMALNNVIKTCKTLNFPLGYHIVDPDPELVKLKIKEGYNFIAFSTDFYFDIVKNDEINKEIMGNKYYYFYDLNEVLIDRYPSRIANKIRDLDPNSSFIFIYSEKYNGDEPKKTPKGSKSYFIPSLNKKKVTKVNKKVPSI